MIISNLSLNFDQWMQMILSKFNAAVVSINLIFFGFTRGRLTIQRLQYVFDIKNKNFKINSCPDDETYLLRIKKPS